MVTLRSPVVCGSAFVGSKCLPPNDPFVVVVSHTACPSAPRGAPPRKLSKIQKRLSVCAERLALDPSLYLFQRTDSAKSIIELVDELPY